MLINNKKINVFYKLLVLLIVLIKSVHIVHAYVPISDEQLFELTPLMNAVEKNNIIAVESLIRAGAKVNELSKSGGTALMIAARKANIKMVTLLLKSGADAKNCGVYDYCPLWYAVDGNNFEVVKKIVHAGANATWNPYNNGTEYPPLHNAVSNNNIRIARFLLEAGADIEFKEYYSNTAAATPLAIAVANGNLEIVKYFLKKGAKIHEVTEVPFGVNASALEHARNKGYMNVVGFIESGLNSKKFKPIYTLRDFQKKLYINLNYIVQKESGDAKEFLNRLSMENLRFLRNTIFARKNYIFKDVELIYYFKKTFPNYKPVSSNISVSEIDKMNIKYLQMLEKQAYGRSIAS